MASLKYIEAKKAEQLERIERKLDLLLKAAGIDPDAQPVQPEAKPEAGEPVDGEPEAKPAKAKK